MKNIKTILENIKKQNSKVNAIEFSDFNQNKKFKNSFNKIYLKEQIQEFIKKVDHFIYEENFDSSDIIKLKKMANNILKMNTPYFSNENEKFISNYLKNADYFIVLNGLRNLKNFSGYTNNDKESLDIYFLYRNLKEEQRYRKSIKRLAKYIIPHLDRAYSFKNDQKPT